MALSDQEEFELLSLEREKALAANPSGSSSLLSMTIPGLGVDPSSQEGKAMIAKVRQQGIDTGMGFGPASMIGSTAKAIVPMIQSQAAKLMQSAIKPLAGQLERGQGQEAVNTALEKGISVSKGGMEKLRSLIDPIDASITEKLASSKGTVPLSSFGPSFNDAIQGAKYSPPSESSSISKALSDFENKFYPGGGELPVQDVQKIKQAYYRSLGPESYGVLTSGERTGMKAVARGAKESVASTVPGIAEENAKLGPLLNALNVIERRVQLAPNKDVGGLAWLAHNLKTGLLMLTARDPYTKSLVARGLYSGANPTTQSALGLGAGTAFQQGQTP